VAGFTNCNLAGADTNGCETTMHSNGVGQNYVDCAIRWTPGTNATYNANMATAARAAWPTVGTDVPAVHCQRRVPDALHRRRLYGLDLQQHPGACRPGAPHRAGGDENGNNCFGGDAAAPTWNDQSLASLSDGGYSVGVAKHSAADSDPWEGRRSALEIQRKPFGKYEIIKTACDWRMAEIFFSPARSVAGLPKDRRHQADPRSTRPSASSSRCSS